MRKSQFANALGALSILLAGCVARSAREPASASLRKEPPAKPVRLSRAGYDTALTVGNTLLFAVDEMVPSSKVDVFRDGAWTTNRLSEARIGVASVVSGQRAYFIGGRSAKGATDVIDVYDAATPSWSVDHLRKPREWAVAASVSGKIVVAGGLNARDDSMRSMAYGTAEVIDAATGAHRIVPMTEKRGSLAAATLEGKAYFIGGNACDYVDRKECAPSATIDVYDAATDAFASPIRMPRPRTRAVAAVMGSRLYVAGGGYFQELSDKLDVLDTASGKWSTFTIPAPGAGGAAIAIDRYVLLLGGVGVSSVVVFDTRDDSVRTTTLATARHSFGATIFGGKAYVAGGLLFQGGGLDDVEVFDPATARFALWSF